MGANTTSARSVSDVSGLQMLRAPDWTANFAVDYTQPTSIGTFAATGTVSYSSSFPETDLTLIPGTNTYKYLQPAYYIANLEAVCTTVRQGVTITAYVKNPEQRSRSTTTTWAATMAPASSGARRGPTACASITVRSDQGHGSEPDGRSPAPVPDFPAALGRRDISVRRAAFALQGRLRTMEGIMITARDRLTLIGMSLSLAGGGLAASPAAATAAIDSTPSSELEAGWNAFYAAVGKASDYIRSHPYYRDAENRASGYAIIAAAMIAALETRVIFDPDFPKLHVHDWRLLSGADNPDQRYLWSRMRGGETYRIWGFVRGERRLDFQVYAGQQTKTSPGRSAAFLSFEELKLGPDGAFEVFVSPNRMGANWIENPSDGTQVMIRQVYSQWAFTEPGEVHIDKVGTEGALKPVLTEAEMGQALREAGDEVLMELAAWATMHEATYDHPDRKTLGEIAGCRSIDTSPRVAQLPIHDLFDLRTS